MKKVFILLLAAGCLFGFGQIVPAEPAVLDEDATRMTLIYLVSKKDANAKMYYDQHLKGKDVNAYHKHAEPGEPEWLNPLTAAIFFDNKEAFDWLLPDADPLAINDRDETPLYYAYHSPNKYYFQELAKTKEARGAIAEIAQLNDAIKDRKTSEVERIIRTGINVNIPDQLGRFPIHYAALTGLPQVVNQIMKRSAKINAQDNNGDTPLHLLMREYGKTKDEGLSYAILGLAFELDADLTIPNNIAEAPINMFNFDQTIEDLTSKFLNRDPKPTEAEINDFMGDLAKVKQKIADAKAKVGGGKPDSSGKKVDDKELINALNVLQNSLSAVVQKL